MSYLRSVPALFDLICYFPIMLLCIFSGIIPGKVFSYRKREITWIENSFDELLSF